MRFPRLAAVLTAGMIALLPSALPQIAQAAPDQPPPQYAPTMLVLDASGSMQRPDPAGTMMDAAKNAVRTFVGSAPAESKVGLATYGTGTGNSEAEKSAGCRDVQLLRRPDNVDKAALTGAVEGIQARGWTPMGTSLRAAAEALPKSGPRSVVLVSDGDDTCSPPDPCDVARELKREGLDLIVHSIGFAVDTKARAQLTCMAQATGGTYSDAADGRALERILPRVTAAALRNYQATGTPITGTSNYQSAPVAVQGQHVDTIGQREKRYYAVDVPAGATAYFSGIMSFPRLPGVDTVDDFNSLHLDVYGRDGKDCLTSEVEQVANSSDGATLTIGKAFDGATEPATGGSADKCKGGGRYYVALTWQRVSTGVPERLPLELLVGIEPAATDPGPKAILPTATFSEPGNAGTPVAGGGSFTTAATLDGSGRYTDTLRHGEFVFYRVKLDWGQGLAYRVHYDANGAGGIGALAHIYTAVYSPLAEEIAWESSVHGGQDTVLPTSDPAVSTVPVRYGNRNADDTHARSQALAGWYYIAVKLGSAREADGDIPVPIRLDLTVSGTPEPGPTYATAVPDGILGKASRGGGDAPRDSVTATAESETTSSPTWIVVGAGAALVVVVVVAATGFSVLRKRRR
ncbi:VWA domain-containing protein [Nocardia sp. BMG51109]|uniref:vWA domain-containing protein n=1 Tax=Nocardia sp. BMG51109 TaxID=1056816 RepID=UPI0004AF5ABB|nr:VWA domain-containing protein [Nocardia sp. BMG51109]